MPSVYVYLIALAIVSYGLIAALFAISQSRFDHELHLGAQIVATKREAMLRNPTALPATVAALKQELKAAQHGHHIENIFSNMTD